MADWFSWQDVASGAIGGLCAWGLIHLGRWSQRRDEHRG